MPKDKVYMTLWRDTWASAGNDCARRLDVATWQALSEALAPLREELQQLKLEINGRGDES